MSPAPKNKSVLVACSLEQYARHTQTFNLYALWTMRFGQTHGVPCPQVRSGGRLAGPRCRSCLPYAKDLGRSRSGRHRLASNICASARAAAPRAAHGLNTHAKSAIGQERLGGKVPCLPLSNTPFSSRDSSSRNSCNISGVTRRPAGEAREAEVVRTAVSKDVTRVPLLGHVWNLRRGDRHHGRSPLLRRGRALPRVHAHV